MVSDLKLPADYILIANYAEPICEKSLFNQIFESEAKPLNFLKIDLQRLQISAYRQGVASRLP